MRRGAVSRQLDPSLFRRAVPGWKRSLIPRFDRTGVVLYSMPIFALNYCRGEVTVDLRSSNS